MPQRTPDHLNDQDWAFALSRNPHMTASLLIEAFKQHAIDIEDGNLSPLPCTNTRTNEAGRDVDAYPRTAGMESQASSPSILRLHTEVNLDIQERKLYIALIETTR